MKKFILPLVLLLGLGSVHAQTLSECCQKAREHYPVVQEYDLIEKTKDFNLSNAARAWIPQLAFSAQASWQTDAPSFPTEMSDMMEMAGVDITGMAQDQYKIALDLRQTIWDGGVSTSQRKIARAKAEVDTYATDIELYNLEGRVEEIYFGILLLDERVAQLEQVQNLLQQDLKKVQSMQRNGLIMESDVAMVEVELLSTGQKLEQNKASLLSYRTMLEVLMGEKLKEEHLARPESAQPVSRESNRLELALFDAKINQLTAEQGLVQTAVIPKFSLFAQGFYGYPGLNMFKNMQNRDLSLNALVGVRMHWDISAFYTNKNKRDQLGLAQDRINVQREVFLYNSDLATTQQDGNIARLEKALQDDSRIVELRQNIRKAAESQLENGTIDMTDFLQKITDENAATLKKNIHEIELLKAQYQLKRILNQ